MKNEMTKDENSRRIKCVDATRKKEIFLQMKFFFTDVLDSKFHNVEFVLE